MEKPGRYGQVSRVPALWDGPYRAKHGCFRCLTGTSRAKQAYLVVNRELIQNQPVLFMATAASGSIFSKPNTLACSGVDFVTRGKALSGCPGSVTSLRVRVARSLSSVVTLCTGSPSGVLLVAALALAGCDGSAFCTGEAPQGPHPRTARVPTPAQVPFQVPGQQAEEHMPEHVLFGVDEDRAHVEPGRLHRTKGPFDLREALVGRHCRVGVDGCGVEIGPDDVDAVQACLGLDLLPVAGPLQIVIGDGEVEVFLHLIPVGLSAEGLQGPVSVLWPGPVLAGGRGDLCEGGFGGPQQILALAGALLAQPRVKQTRRRSPGNSGLRISATVSGTSASGRRGAPAGLPLGAFSSLRRSTVRRAEIQSRPTGNRSVPCVPR